MAQQQEQISLLGKRISLNTYRGTVRYAGPVPPAKGEWLGIEWDDPSRGKHDGTSIDGTSYFQVRIPGSASFIRSTASNLSFGSSLLYALREKYLPSQHVAPTAPTPKQHFSRKNLADIEIETPNMDGVIQRVARLDRLREVGLAGSKLTGDQAPGYYAEVAMAIDQRQGEETGSIRQTCPNIRWLDLSRSLLADWNELARITFELEHLQVLLLHFNRFQTIPAAIPTQWSTSFCNLKDLRLDGTLMTWQDLLRLSPTLPNLESLQLGSNWLDDLPPPSTRVFPKLKTLDLEGNSIASWSQVVAGLVPLPQLETLHLTDNLISSILVRSPSDPVFPALEHISLTNNPLSLWVDIENLQTWFTSSFSLNILPFDEHASGPSRVGTGTEERASKLVYSFERRNFRAILIARLEKVATMDRSQVTDKERRDAELYVFNKVQEGDRGILYGQVAKDEEQGVPSTVNLSLEEKRAIFPRYQELAERYGATTAPTETSSENNVQGTLRSKLITLRVTTSSSAPCSTRAHSPSSKVKLLSSTPLRLAKLKLAKVAGLKPTQVSSIWAILGKEVVFQMEDLTKDFAWYDFKGGETVVLVI